MSTQEGAVGTPRPAFDPKEAEARMAEAQALTKATRDEYSHQLGIPYGSHHKQVLDLYLPSHPEGAPTLIFLHGGAFRVGEPGSVGYHGRPYLAAGAIFASMGYRLAPEVRFPDSCDDIEAGLEWLWANVADRGGDPDRIYLSGHSAGAMLAASVGLRPRHQATPDLVKGLVLISGMYDFTNQPSDILNPDSPRHVAKLTEAIERTPDHTVVVAGEQDFPPAVSGAHAMLEALKARGASAELFIEPGADHFRANQSFIVDGGAVFNSTKQMMKL